MLSPITKKEGFTLIEAIIAMAIGLMVVLSISALIGYFALYTRDVGLKFCLTSALENGFSLCRNGKNPPNSYTCGNYSISISYSTDCTTIPSDSCSNVTITASYSGKVYSMTDRVCRWSR